MILAALAAAALPLGPLPPAPLASGECAFFLWAEDTPPRLVARAGPVMEIVLDGRLRRLARADAEAAAPLSPTGRYADAETSVTLDLSLEERRNLVGGALATGLIRLDRANADGLALPVAGMLACR